MSKWPKDITTWQDDRTGYMSIPFTWLLPKAQTIINQRELFVDRWFTGGPAVELDPDYLVGATIGEPMAGVLQRVNPQATRTSLGCPKHCQFCAIGQRLIEPQRQELSDWPDLPIICDNNLLATSCDHFRRVMERLRHHNSCDIQGVDAAYVTPWHALWLARLRKPILRLAVDTDADMDVWGRAVECLLDHGVAKSHIRTYVLCGWDGSPEDDWRRCEFVESFGLKALPMWYHPLDAMEYNAVTAGQERLGWTKELQRQLMGYYYKHRGEKLCTS